MMELARELSKAKIVTFIMLMKCPSQAAGNNKAILFYPFSSNPLPQGERKKGYPLKLA
jgi:hypothetical protein